MGLLPTPTIKWTPPPPLKKRVYKFEPCSEYLKNLPETPSPPKTYTELERQTKELKIKKQKAREQFQSQRSKYNPHKDPHITTPPQCTLFIGRLAYTVTEEDLKSIFSNYGQITHLRILHGYAFIAFDNPESVNKAILSNNGYIQIKSRQAVLDNEHARLMRKWTPRRLGGGLGGRFNLERRKAEIQRMKHLEIKSQQMKTPNRTLRRY